MFHVCILIALAKILKENYFQTDYYFYLFYLLFIEDYFKPILNIHFLTQLRYSYLFFIDRIT